MSKISLNLTSSVRVTAKLYKWLTLAASIAQSELPKGVKEAPLSITLCGDSRMRKINKAHRGKDKTTDVLSFPAQENLHESKSLDWSQPGVLPLGDLIISLPVARKQAQRFKVSLETEVVHLFFHGFLHLLGHDHERSESEEKLMQKLEAKLLASFSKKRKRA
jgi:probable rRNA maturation factor